MEVFVIWAAIFISSLILVNGYLSLYFYCCDKYHNKKHFGGKDIFPYIPLLQSIIKGSQDRDSGQEPWNRNWSRSHGGKLTGFLCLFSYISQDHVPRNVIPTVGWVLPRQYVITYNGKIEAMNLKDRNEGKMERLGGKKEMRERM